MAKTINCCIYCDRELRGVRSREHIIPKALGSSEKIRCVCIDCNNDFSKLDKHLITCSPIYLIDYRHRMTKGGLWYDTDEDDEYLIIEAHPDSSQTNWTTWPQIIFCERDTQVRGDLEEVEEIGADAWQARFFKHLCDAYTRFQSGEKRAILFWPNPGMSLRGRYPPRIFAERAIHEFGPGMHFKARYEDEQQRNAILAQLEKLTPKTRIGTEMRIATGSKSPGGRMSGDVLMVYRALTKIAINALAFCCENTEVDRYAFREAVCFIQTQRILWTGIKRYMVRCGFVRPVQLEPLCCPENTHVLHLCHYAGSQHWQMYFVFYGGAVGGRIEFPGPNHETWRSITMIAPFRGASKKWICTPSQEIIAPEVDVVAWNDGEFFRKVVPSVSPIVRESNVMTIRSYQRRR